MRTLVLAFVLGCSATSAPLPSPPPSPPPPSPPAAMPPQSAIPGAYAMACETECADDMAELVTYRDANGAIAMITVQGSPARCDHPPLRFIGPDGAERAAIPMQPVVPGSPEAKHFDDIRAQQVGGLAKDARTLHCRDVKH